MKLKTAICLWAEFDGDFAHIKGYVCQPELKDGMPQPVDRYEHPLHNVKLHSQASRGNIWTGMYGMDVNVGCYDRVSLREAKKAVDTLAPIDRKVTKLIELEGSPKSYGQWINQIARAIGAEIVYIKRIDPAANRTQYTASKIGNLVYDADALEQRIGQWANPESIAA